MALTKTALADILAEVDFMTQPAERVQAVAEKAIIAVVSLAANHSPDVNIKRLTELL